MSARKVARPPNAHSHQVPSRAWSQGAMLAVHMLVEIQGERGDDTLAACTIEDEFRPRGTPQRDVVGKYFSRLQGAEMTAGFTAMLTHWLACREHSGPQYMGHLELLAQYPWREANKRWLKALHEDAAAKGGVQ